MEYSIYIDSSLVRYVYINIRYKQRRMVKKSLFFNFEPLEEKNDIYSSNFRASSCTLSVLLLIEAKISLIFDIFLLYKVKKKTNNVSLKQSTYYKGENMMSG